METTRKFSYGDISEKVKQKLNAKKNRTRRTPEQICEAMKEKYPQISKIDYGFGYDTPNGHAYDVMLKNGFCWEFENSAMHWFSEGNLKDLEATLKTISTCNCDDDCKKANQIRFTAGEE